MPAGIQIFNDAGTIQIDENYQNIFVVDSGVLGVDPIPSLAGYPDSMLARGFTKWFIFGTLPTGLPDPGYGFQVFTSTGKLAFDATRKPLRYVARVTGYVGPGASYHSYPAGRSYACIAGTAHWTWLRTTEKAGSATWNVTVHKEVSFGSMTAVNEFRAGMQVVEHTEYVADSEVYPQGAETRVSDLPADFMIIDVTGY